MRRSAFLFLAVLLAGAADAKNFNGFDVSEATGPDGEELPTVIGFWFAWFTFHPETQIWKAGG